MEEKNVSENSGKIQDTTKFLCLYKQLLSRDLNWIGDLSFFFLLRYVCWMQRRMERSLMTCGWTFLMRTVATG